MVDASRVELVELQVLERDPVAVGDSPGRRRSGHRHWKRLEIRPKTAGGASGRSCGGKCELGPWRSRWPTIPGHSRRP